MNAADHTKLTEAESHLHAALELARKSADATAELIDLTEGD